METYFNIRYEFDRSLVHALIDNRLKQPGSEYVCVADGNILVRVYQSEEYKNVVNSAMFAICDGHWATVYLRWIYGIKRDSYCGSEIFEDLLKKRRYSMAFVGGSSEALSGLQNYVNQNYPNQKYCFHELPFMKVEDFNYKDIGEAVNKMDCDIVWIGLGAPKQEIFMNRLRPFLRRGIMIGVGAVFNFYGNDDVKRAPLWVRKVHLEFLHRIFAQPQRQLPKMTNYLKIVPKVILQEYKNKNKNSK